MSGLEIEYSAVTAFIAATCADYLSMLVASDKYKLSPEQSQLFTMYHFIERTLIFVFDFILSDIGTGYRFGALMLSVCPY